MDYFCKRYVPLHFNNVNIKHETYIFYFKSVRYVLSKNILLEIIRYTLPVFFLNSTIINFEVLQRFLIFVLIELQQIFQVHSEKGHN